jgi:hypothetical protein
LGSLPLEGDIEAAYRAELVATKRFSSKGSSILVLHDAFCVSSQISLRRCERLVS